MSAEPLWTQVQATGGRDYYRMAGLRATALYYWLHQLGMTMPHHGIDQYTPYFQEIIRLTRDVMDFESRDGANESMETGIILPLSLVVGACRHYPTQQEGFRLLLGAQKKEGIVESKSLALVINQMKQDDPEWWKQSKVCFEPDQIRLGDGHSRKVTGLKPEHYKLTADIWAVESLEPIYTSLDHMGYQPAGTG